jgi:hypothetical protein
MEINGSRGAMSPDLDIWSDEALRRTNLGTANPSSGRQRRPFYCLTPLNVVNIIINNDDEITKGDPNVF